MMILYLVLPPLATFLAVVILIVQLGIFKRIERIESNIHHLVSIKEGL